VKLHSGVLLGTEVAWQLSASKGARMDNVLKELHLGGGTLARTSLNLTLREDLGWALNDHHDR
jgi:hypothetical protein